MAIVDGGASRSRRAILAGGMAAFGAIAARALGAPTPVDASSAVQLGASNTASAPTTVRNTATSPAAVGLIGRSVNPGATGLQGLAEGSDGRGVRGIANTGSNAIGVVGAATQGTGVRGTGSTGVTGSGIGVGVSYGGGERLGLLITIAIAAHNVPEGLAISVVLVPRGASVRSAAWWSVFSSLPQPLIAPLAYLFVESFTPFLPVGLGFAAGAMLWMVWSELLPEALADAPKRALALGGGLSFAVMLGAQVLLFGV